VNELWPIWRQREECPGEAFAKSCSGLGGKGVLLKLVSLAILASLSAVAVCDPTGIPPERRILAATPYSAELRIPYDHFGSSRKKIVDQIRSALKLPRPYDGAQAILTIKDIRISEVFETAKDVFQSQKYLPEVLHAMANSLPLTDRRRFTWRLVMPIARIAWGLKRVDTGLETGGDYWPEKISTAKDVSGMPVELLFLSLCYGSMPDLRQQRVLAHELVRRLPNDGYAFALAARLFGMNDYYASPNSKPTKDGRIDLIEIPFDAANYALYLRRAYELLPNHPSIGYSYACRFLLKKDKPMAIKLIKRYLAAYPKPLNREPAKQVLKRLGAGL
jgi:hypothetical protein